MKLLSLNPNDSVAAVTLDKEALQSAFFIVFPTVSARVFTIYCDQFAVAHPFKARSVGSRPPREQGRPGGKISRAKRAPKILRLINGVGSAFTCALSTESVADYSTQAFTH